MADELVLYDAGGQEVGLSPKIVRDFLVQGNGRVSDQEVAMFIELCKFRGMNPFTREAYLIKYGDNAPASVVTGKDFFTRRAAENPNCRGWEAGVIVKGAQGQGFVYREGSFVAPAEELVGGYSIVYRTGWEPQRNSVSLLEYVRYNKQGQKQANWTNMPGTMIRKVALVQGLRETFPEQFGGLYSQEEMQVDATRLPDQPIEGDLEVAEGYLMDEPPKGDLFLPKGYVAEKVELTEDDLAPTGDEFFALKTTLDELKKNSAEVMGRKVADVTKSIVTYTNETFGKAKPAQLTRFEWRCLFDYLEKGIDAARKTEDAVQATFGDGVVVEDGE